MESVKRPASATSAEDRMPAATITSGSVKPESDRAGCAMPLREARPRPTCASRARSVQVTECARDRRLRTSVHFDPTVRGAQLLHNRVEAIDEISAIAFPLCSVLTELKLGSAGVFCVLP